MRQVHGAVHDHAAGRDPAVRIHFHRNVLHLHLLLGVQDLLRLRIHASGLFHPDDRDRLCELMLLMMMLGLPVLTLTSFPAALLTPQVTIVCTYFLLNAEDYRW